MSHKLLDFITYHHNLSLAKSFQKTWKCSWFLVLVQNFRINSILFGLTWTSKKNEDLLDSRPPISLSWIFVVESNLVNSMLVGNLLNPGVETFLFIADPPIVLEICNLFFMLKDSELVLYLLLFCWKVSAVEFIRKYVGSNQF